MITGINHINIAVSDMQRSFLFYRDILGFTPLCKSEGSAYFLVGHSDAPGCLWFSLDLDRENIRRPSPCNTHMAFTVSAENFPSIAQRILQSGAPLFKNNTSPGNSLYFLDPDDHKLEIHEGNWRERIEAKKADPGKWKNVEWFI